jgi:hypothetical protein
LNLASMRHRPRAAINRAIETPAGEAAGDNSIEKVSSTRENRSSLPGGSAGTGAAGDSAKKS